MNRNTYLSSQYTVPSLSLASSRSKKTIPTKDIDIPKSTMQTKSRVDIMDRMNRPPIFSSKLVKESRISAQNTNVIHTSSVQSSVIQTTSSNINRNVYLQQIDSNDSHVTFRGNNNQQSIPRSSNMIRSPSGGNLLRNPESGHIVGLEMERRIQTKKVDINKSLFDRKIKKLLQQADFYDKELMGMYADNSQILSKELQQLQRCRKDALSFTINPNLIDII